MGKVILFPFFNMVTISSQLIKIQLTETSSHYKKQPKRFHSNKSLLVVLHRLLALCLTF